MARLDGEKALMVMQAADTARGASLTDGATKHMRELGFKLESGMLERHGGLEAFVGVYTGKTKGVGEVRVRAAHVTVGRQVYMLAGIAPGTSFRASRPNSAGGRVVPRALEQRGGGRASQPARRLRREARRLVAVDRAACRQRARAATRLALMNGFAVDVQPPAGRR